MASVPLPGLHGCCHVQITTAQVHIFLCSLFGLDIVTAIIIKKPRKRAAIDTMADIQDLSTNSLTDPALLDKIDKLFACNVGDYVALPQLIAVGDQSSGKSSILEGLTGLPFPRDSTLCTRFATQITFRRATGQVSRRIRATIKPASQSTPECVAKLKAWTRSETGTLSPKVFSDMIQQVHTVMGIRTLEDQSKPTFARHVFRLEISGPDEDHLSVIDVPGIFKTVTPGVTTKNDIEVVRGIVQEYMKNPRSIILAVVPANVDVATQEVIERAREVDPEGQRTLGVLTKPDLVDRGAEAHVLDLIAGRNMPLRHGWVLVRNLGKSELAIGDRTRAEVEEELIKKEGWSTIAPDRFGIESLRKRLQETITDNARREFPMVRLDINKKLNETKTSLNSLGHERATREQQVDYLLDIVAKFETIMANALRGNYGADEIFEKVKQFRLATTIINRNEQFKADMMALGHVYRFRGEETEPPQPVHQKVEKEETQFITRKIETKLDLNGTLVEGELLAQPVEDDIYQWLAAEYQGSRGFEIGTFSTALLPSVMKKQTIKWESIALGYVSDLIAVVNAFIVTVINDLCPDQRISRGLLSIMTDGLQKRYQAAMDHTRFLLENERNDTLMSLHQSFTATLQDRPELKMQRYLTEKTFHAGNVTLGKVVRVDDIRAALPGLSNLDFMLGQVHDILRAYYFVAQTRFVDNVCMQSANYFLLSGPKSPIKLLSPTFIYRLSNQELEDVAGEDPVIHRQRLQYTKEMEDLEVARKIIL
ncbi:P-loop containing nucleoside triphosphate hydrolase protein [Aspergillus karnatakaensis]|uniref:dynamin family protein n=1 Tax=Aspergillus karnatakaensis TaxID=1810916 RepID=UPI003CCE3C30